MAQTFQNGPIFPSPFLDAADLATADLAQRAIQTIAASGAAQTLDVNSYACVNITLTANCTLTLTDPASNGLWAFVIYATQGGVGGYSTTFPAGTLFDSGTQPAPSTTLGSVCKYVCTARRVLGVTTWDVTLSADALAV